MTACVNKKHTRRVALAISASLVGALSLGAAAPVAFAEGVDTQFAEGGTDGTEFVEGTIQFDFNTLSGAAVNDVHVGTDIDGNTTVSAAALPFTVSADSVTPAGTGKPVSVGADTDFKVALYKADEDGEPTGSPLSGNRVTAVGGYVLTVTPLTGASYVGQTFKQYFEVVPMKIQVGQPFENGDQNDQHFIFTGSALDLGFAMDGEELVEGVDYTVKYTKIYGFDANGNRVNAGAKNLDEVVDAGVYNATVTGIGRYTGSVTTSQFTVNRFGIDTKSADMHFYVDPFTSTPAEHPSRVVYDPAGTDHDAELDPTLVSIEYPAINSDYFGPLTVELHLNQDAVEAGNVFVAGSNQLTTVLKVNDFADLLYNGQELQDSYDLMVGQKFNLAAVTASYNGTSLSQEVYVNGVEASSAAAIDTSKPGTYELTFVYNPAGSKETGVSKAIDGNVLSATKTVTIRVWSGSINADEGLWVYGPEYTHDGKPGVAIQSYTKAYDGNALTADDFFVVNKDRTASNLKIDGKQPTLEAKLYDAKGNEVDKAIEAGDYTLKVTSDTWLLSGTLELPIHIVKVDLTTAKINKLKQWNDVAGEWYLEDDDSYDFTSNKQAISTLELAYDTGNGTEDTFVADNFKGYDLIPDNVDVTVEFDDEGTWKPVSNADKAGQYRAILTVGEDVAANYGLPEGENSVTLEFTVAAKKVFSDVQPSAWYYGSVNEAVKQGYVHGDSGSTTFRPEATITRGEVAVVLYNMSGIDKSFMKNETDSSYYEEGKGWKTGFSDVDGEAFYAKAVAWAKRAGVVNGYDGTTEFRPDAPVTSEEFAAMLSNYAEKVNQDATVAEADPSSLDGVASGSEVSGWARKAVAWAVENEVMGNNGASIDAHGSIIRARVAAMCVNYQPSAKNL